MNTTIDQYGGTASPLDTISKPYLFFELLSNLASNFSGVEGEEWPDEHASIYFNEVKNQKLIYAVWLTFFSGNKNNTSDSNTLNQIFAADEVIFSNFQTLAYYISDALYLKVNDSVTWQSFCEKFTSSLNDGDPYLWNKNINIENN